MCYFYLSLYFNPVYPVIRLIVSGQFSLARNVMLVFIVIAVVQVVVVFYVNRRVVYRD